MSRADRVRAMSDEDLVDLMFRFNIDEHVRFCEDRPECVETMETDDFDAKGVDCKACALRWLRQPAEEEDDGEA